jgi:hypothetical protein
VKITIATLTFVLSLINTIKYFIKAQTQMSIIHHLTSNIKSFLAPQAPHQTVRSDPKMTNIIHKILTTNDREQYKDNNNKNIFLLLNFFVYIIYFLKSI